MVSILTDARYADWLEVHPEYLQHLFPFVIQGLKSKEVAPAAALSFNNVCDACAQHLTSHMEAVMKVCILMSEKAVILIPVLGI